MTTAILLYLEEGNYLSLLLVLLVPGYVLVAALLPRQADADWIERLALSIGLSAAVVPLLVLLLNFTPFGIRFLPVVATIVSFTLVVSLVAWWRRLRLPATERISVTLGSFRGRWTRLSFPDKGVAIAIAASLVVAGGAITYFLLSLHPGERYTEFYILGPDGSASNYPTRLRALQPGSVIMGITSHEAASENYAVRVDLVGVGIVYNATEGANETVEMNRTMWSWFNVTLPDGQSWVQPYTFAINATGTWKVQFLLFAGGDPSIYRELHLFVLVT